MIELLNNKKETTDEKTSPSNIVNTDLPSSQSAKSEKPTSRKQPTSSSRTASQPEAASSPQPSEDSDLPTRNHHKQRKTLFIGDSISANVNKEALVDATKRQTNFLAQNGTET